MKTEKYVVKKIVKFGLMCGYQIFDTESKKYLPWFFDEHEEYLAESKCKLKNALAKR
jgi:hypothetical protein